MEHSQFKVIIDLAIQPIIPEFIAGMQEDLVAARQYVQEQQFDEVMKLGHKCKGSSGSYGFEELCELFQKMEELSEQGEVRQILSTLDHIENYLKNVEIDYKELDDEDDD